MFLGSSAFLGFLGRSVPRNSEEPRTPRNRKGVAGMRTVWEGKHIFVRERDGWEYVERKKATEAVIVVAKTDDGKVVLVEQERKPLAARVIEFPAGLVGDEDDSDAAATARKELEEETGFTCAKVERLAGGPSSAGITSEIIHYFRATGLRRAGDGGGVEGENIRVHLVPEPEIRDWLRAKEREGLLIDAKLWSGLYWLTL